MVRVTTFALLIVSSLGGCATDPQTTDPQPIPVPAPDPSAMYLSGPSKTTLVAGEPGAVASPTGGLEIVVHNPTQDTSHRAAVHSDGSFLLSVSWNEGDKLSAWVEKDGRRGEEVVVKTPLGEAPIMTPATIDNISAVDPGTGQTTISGTSSGGSLLLAGNLDQSAAQSVVVDSSGQFSVSVDAAPGDRIAVFYVAETAAPTGAAVSPALEGQVPES